MRRSFLSVICLTPLVAFAQIPYHNDCAHAIPVPVAGGNVQVEFTFNDAHGFPGAVPSPITPCSGSANTGSGWYSFVAMHTRHWVRTEGDRLDDASIEVFSGTCGSLTSILCMPAASAYVPVTGLAVGATYFIRVVTPYPCSNGGNTACQLGLAVVSDPPHDECSGAIELTVMSAQAQAFPATEIATLGATQSQAACAGGAAASNDDVWYRFTATATAHHFPHVSLRSNSTQDVVVQWFSGSCGALTSIACDQPRATGLTVGQPYFIRVHTESTDATVNERFLGDLYASAPNDECGGAFPIAVAQSGEEAQPVKVSTWLGTSSAVTCDTQPTDVWLTFTAPSISVTAWSSSDQKLTFFSGSCGSLVCITSGTTTSGAPSVQCDNLIVGDTYFLKIGDSTSPDNSSIRMYATPNNDECTSAAPLGVLPLGSASGYTYGHTFAASVSGATDCMGPQPSDVWYSFTATAPSHLIHRERFSPVEFRIEVLGGSCGTLTSLYCSAFISTPDLVTGLVPGTTYYIRLFNTLNAEPTAFRIGVTEAAANDECAGAIDLTFADVPDFTPDDRVENYLAQNGTSTCGQTLRDVWYKFTAVDPTAVFVVALTDAVGGGGYVELLSGTCGSLTSISCPTLDPVAAVRYSGLTTGTEYHLRYSLSSSFTPMLIDKPDNDEITGAQVVPVGGSAFGYVRNEGFNYGATPSFPVFCGSNVFQVNDIWFKFTATATSHTVLSVPGNLRFMDQQALAALRMEVYDTLSTSAATLDAHVIGCGSTSIQLTGLTVGHDYWYRVFSGSFGAAEVCTFTTNVYSGNNDEANGALTLQYADDYTLFFNTSGATQSQPGADCSVVDVADDDIWFKFTAGASGRIVAGHSTANLALELFSGTPGNLVSIACSDNILVLPQLTSGQTYYVRLYSWENAIPTEGRLGLFATPSLTANTCVDEGCLGPGLLENPSIEQGAYCLSGFPSIATLEGLGIPIAPGWPQLQFGSADGYSSCEDNTRPADAPAAGINLGGERVIPRTGKGMAGVILKDNGASPDYREYIQAAFTEALIPGEPYLISFHVAHAPGSRLRVNGMGAVLSRGPLTATYYQPIAASPQVVTLDVLGDGWTNICGIVVPDEAWNNITIGCFLAADDQYTYEGLFNGEISYYFIDDVVVARVTDPGCITSIGDVPPMDEGTTNKGDALRVYPNPASGSLTIVADAGLFGQRGVIEVFDATGSRVSSEQVGSFGALQPLDLSRDLKEGLYLLMVRVEGQGPRTTRVVVRR